VQNAGENVHSTPKESRYWTKQNIEHNEDIPRLKTGIQNNKGGDHQLCQPEQEKVDWILLLEVQHSTSLMPS
jgi:hypothetical protein